MPALTSVSRNGSTAVEFSGQTTKSGRGRGPRRRRRRGRSVSRRGWRVTSRWTAGMSVAVPGTSPWTAATVAVAACARAGTAHERRARAVTTASPATTAVRRPGGRARVEHQPGERRAGQRDQQADARHADPRQRAGPRRVGGRVDEPAPRHPAEGPAAAPRLDRRPTTARPHRPRAQPHAPAQTRCRAARRRPPRGAQRDPGVRADRAHPDHQRVDEAQAEDQARQPRPTRARRPRTHRTSTAIASGISQRASDRLEGQRQHERRRARASEAAEQHGTDRSRRPDAGIGPAAVREEPRTLRTNPHADWLPSAGSCLRTRVPSASALAGRDRPPWTRRWASLAPRAPRASHLGRRSATHDLHRRTRNPLVHRRGGVNTALTCDDRAFRRSSGPGRRRNSGRQISGPSACRRMTRRR